MSIKVATTLAGGRGTTLCPDHNFGLTSRRYLFSSHLSKTSPHSHSHSPPSIFINQQHHHLKLQFITRAADSTQPSSSATLDASIIPDDEFSLAKVSFGVIGLGLGVTLLSYGFGAYFNILPGSEWSALMLTYGFPLAIIGMALKYAELKPVPCLTYSDAEKLRETCATPILKQVRNDVIRYRYGDEQHLEEALKRIFQYGLGGGIPRRSAPILQVIREEVNEDGKYCLVLVFEAKSLQLSDFERRQVRNDVIRYRYGDEQHLEEALKRIFQYGLGGGIPRRSASILQVIREEVNEDGKYCLVLVFEAKSLQLSDFERRQAKFASFFGPGITAEIGKGENDLYEVRLISDTTPQ